MLKVWARRSSFNLQSEDERVALMAADKVFERAWGRPKSISLTPKLGAANRASPVWC